MAKMRITYGQLFNLEVEDRGLSADALRPIMDKMMVAVKKYIDEEREYFKREGLRACLQCGLQSQKTEEKTAKDMYEANRDVM
jgi:hypothetical protein